MNNSKKILQLQRLITQANEIKNRNSNDPTFKTWKNTVERTLIRVFGNDSPELEHFHNLRFFYTAMIMTLGSDYSHEDRECFDRDFKILISSINNYIEELQQDDENNEEDSCIESLNEINRIFISHSSQDIPFIEELIELLELIGVPEESIFCTSLAGYGIDLGENFLESIKDELQANTLVLFVLSRHFYASPVCLRCSGFRGQSNTLILRYQKGLFYGLLEVESPASESS